MLIAFVLLVLCCLATVVGTTKSEAISLYYDAQDVLADGTLANAPHDVETSDSEPVHEEVYDNAPAAVEEQPKRVTLTVGGNTANKSKAKNTPSKQDTMASLRNAAATRDPNKERAQQMFDDIRRNGL